MYLFFKSLKTLRKDLNKTGKYYLEINGKTFLTSLKNFVILKRFLNLLRTYLELHRNTSKIFIEYKLDNGILDFGIKLKFVILVLQTEFFITYINSILDYFLTKFSQK